MLRRIDFTTGSARGFLVTPPVARDPFDCKGRVAYERTFVKGRTHIFVTRCKRQVVWQGSSPARLQVLGGFSSGNRNAKGTPTISAMAIQLHVHACVMPSPIECYLVDSIRVVGRGRTRESRGCPRRNIGNRIGSVLGSRISNVLIRRRLCGGWHRQAPQRTLPQNCEKGEVDANATT